MAKYPSIVLFTNDVNALSNAGWKGEYQDFLDINNLDEDDLSLEDFIAESIDLDFRDLKDNLRFCSNQSLQDCVIFGKLGLWDGVHEIEPIKCNDLWTAIEKCINKADVVEISLNNGVINVSATHHDGTNNFEIRLLNSKGKKIQDNNKLIKYTKKYVGYLY